MVFELENQGGRPFLNLNFTLKPFLSFMGSFQRKIAILVSIRDKFVGNCCICSLKYTQVNHKEFLLPSPLLYRIEDKNDLKKAQ